MSLQWYPGHMGRARRELLALMPSQDVVIEVLDARAPAASSNPVITELRGDKPCIKVLTNDDLADPVVTKAWLRHFIAAGQGTISAIASAKERPGETRKRIRELTDGLAARRGPHKTVRALIAGCPNVGKSTLINTLANRNVAKVSDKPAVTKEQQSVLLENGTILTDSPGMMWPKLEDEAGALRLAIAGSIPPTAFDYLTIGMFAAELLLARYGPLVTTRYKLPATPATAEALLTEIGRRRGGLQKGGTIDLHKAAEVLIHELRSGIIGRVSLEVPPVATALDPAR